jgi:hypothetical protein
MPSSAHVGILERDPKKTPCDRKNPCHVSSCRAVGMGVFRVISPRSGRAKGPAFRGLVSDRSTKRTKTPPTGRLRRPSGNCENERTKTPPTGRLRRPSGNCENERTKTPPTGRLRRPSGNCENERTKTPPTGRLRRPSGNCENERTKTSGRCRGRPMRTCENETTKTNNTHSWVLLTKGPIGPQWAGA